MTTFDQFNFSSAVRKGVQAAGYTTPSPIQAAAIPDALAGRDLIGCAQTGTGKTAAFVLPMLEKLAGSMPAGNNRPVRALVVVPTRELALQVDEAVQTYGKFTGLRSLAIFGGVGAGPQLQGLRRGADVVVATPGRLLDYLSDGRISLQHVEVLVLDEADRMFDMGFIRDIRKIVAAVPKQRQTLLFSATMPPPIQELANSILTRPAFVEVGTRRNPAKTVTQQVCMVAGEHKVDLLFHVLEQEPTDSVIVFTRTKHRADKIKRKLGQRGFKATVLHSNRSQGQRQQALEGFKNGTYPILVATDIAARGIDVDGISHVINFDTPNQPEDYIHRIGRTGRAEASGDALTFVSPDEAAYLRDIEKHIGRKIEAKRYDDFSPPPSEHATTPPAARKPAPAQNPPGTGKKKRRSRRGPQQRARTTA